MNNINPFRLILLMEMNVLHDQIFIYSKITFYYFYFTATNFELQSSTGTQFLKVVSFLYHWALNMTFSEVWNVYHQAW